MIVHALASFSEVTCAHLFYLIECQRSIEPARSDVEIWQKFFILDGDFSMRLRHAGNRFVDRQTHRFAYLFFGNFFHFFAPAKFASLSLLYSSFCVTQSIPFHFLYPLWTLFQFICGCTRESTGWANNLLRRTKWWKLMSIWKNCCECVFNSRISLSFSLVDEFLIKLHKINSKATEVWLIKVKLKSLNVEIVDLITIIVDVDY